MPASDRLEEKRALLSPVRIVAIGEGDSVKYITIEAEQRLTETLYHFAKRHPEVLADPKLRAAVVIEGVMYAQIFKADTFRWLCGAGPDPTGKDKDWMG